MGLILRTTKGTPLTYQEMDGNLTYLEGLNGGPSGSAFTGSFSGSFTGSYFGTASYAISASWAPNNGSTFPYTGSAIISGSLGITGSISLLSGSINLTDKNQAYKINGTNILSISQGVGSYNINLGNGATGTDSGNGGYISIGDGASSTDNSISIGLSSNTANSIDSISIGRASSVGSSIVRGVSLGRNSVSSHNNSWAMGWNSSTTRDNEFCFGDPTVTHYYNLRGTPTSKTSITGSLEVSGSTYIKGNLKHYITGSTVTGSNLLSSEMTSYLDESNNKLIFLVRYSNGTLKSGSVDLI